MTRVLIVDDKEENLYYLRALLTGNGCEVDEARHGAEALVRARQHAPNLIISDLLMPVMDGYTLLRHWKADPRLNKIPFIVYTATYTEIEDERLAINLGADAFILKPAEPEDFLSRIRQVQSNTAAAVPAMPQNVVGDEKELLKVYSETLIRKLEEKMLLLEEANHALEKDIAERKKVEEALRKSEQEQRAQATLLDKAQDAIVVRDLAHLILYWNKSAERLYGWTTEEVLGRTVNDLLYKDAAVFQSAMEEALRTGEWVGEIEQKTKAGKTLTIEGRWTLVRDDAGQPKSILAINTNITERRKLEQQFLRAQRMESIGTLAGGIAHDLNNVLAPIIMSIELLKIEETNTRRLDILRMIESSANRGASMVNQVLSFARGLEGRRVEVQAKHLVNDIIKITGETFPKNIRVVNQADMNLWNLKADPTQLHQVLLNLCVNARDAMPDGGQITISAENVMIDEQFAAMNIEARVGPYIKIEVEDTGHGIPKEIIDQIFDPFFTTKEVGKGTGLGLSTALAIIKSHGGFIRVYTEPGLGSKFRIYFPAYPQKSIIENADGDGGLPRGNGEMVLLVDDEMSIRQITKQTLEAFGYRVLLATDGSEAVSQYVQNQKEVALVLLDMMMPVMDGPATIQILLRHNPKLKIIGASGISSSGKVANPEGLGVKIFLPKPYTAETLLKAIKKVLAEAV